MKTNRKIMLGLAVVAILTLSVGAVYAIAAPQYLQGASFAGMTGGRGSGGMMSGSTANPGRMMTRSQGGTTGAFGNMMSVYTSMMGSAGSMMGQYGGMMSQMFQHMTGSWNKTPNGPDNSRLLAISDYAFYPSSVTVPKGTTITWINMDFVQHTVTSGTEQGPTGPFGSNPLGHMQSFSYTFNTAGTYSYYCDLHPNMIGTIQVSG
ncbi:MAG TPA: plastocyanin/azurin family copper-binding protein [Nitrososphaerales archaeon]|nr:plastocyanin/azurin family copper-binding protein [Nitrososphaerales archaeon]